MTPHSNSVLRSGTGRTCVASLIVVCLFFGDASAGMGRLAVGDVTPGDATARIIDSSGSANAPHMEFASRTWESGAAVAGVVPKSESQRVWYVAIDGDDAGSGTREQPFLTIRRAVDAAASGDTVVIGDGAYSGTGNREIDIADRFITLQSESDDPAACTINLSGWDGVQFRTTNNEADGGLFVRGISFIGGNCAISIDSAGPHGERYAAAAFQATRCRFVGNNSGLHVRYGIGSIASCVFKDNSVAGLSLEWQVDYTIDSCHFEGNGVGFRNVIFTGQDHTCINSVFVRNTVGIDLDVDMAHFTFTSCRSDSNSLDGLAVRGSMSGVINLTDCSMRDNGRVGVRVWLTLLHLNMTGGEVSGNASHGFQVGAIVGGLSLVDVLIAGNGGCGVDGLSASQSGDYRGAGLTRCLIIDNKLDGVLSTFQGLGVYECVIARNGGDGVRLQQVVQPSSLRIQHSTIADNGGAGLVSDYASAELTNSLVAFNTGVAAVFSNLPALSVNCCDVYGNSGGDWTGALGSHFGTNGNRSTDPLFCDFVGGEYGLQENSPLSAGNSGGCGTIGRYDSTCPAQSPAPFVPILGDVPDDQGGRLHLSWLKCPADAPEIPVPVTSYDVQRLVSGWQTVATMAATAADSYSTVIGTTDILILGQPAPYSRYRLVARTANPSINFESVEGRAYSIDNLAPPKPNAALIDGLDFRVIHWGQPDIPDLSLVCVYRGDDSGFTPGEPLTCLAADYYNETHLARYFYRVQFIDVHGNRSAFSDELHGRYPTGVPVSAVTALRLYPNRPNPFNPATTIRFDLPESGPVRLSVFDLAGRVVRELLDENQSAGTHEAVWDGRDANGRGVASGSYLARLEFGGRVESVRMGLVR